MTLSLMPDPMVLALEQYNGGLFGRVTSKRNSAGEQ
jgi:hypothetical protein